MSLSLSAPTAPLLPRRFVAPLSVCLTLICLLILCSAAGAQAAAAFTSTGVVSELRFAEETVASGSEARIDGRWTIEDHPSNPAGFEVGLPEGITGTIDHFSLHTPDGRIMGSCAVEPARLACELDANYVAEHPLDLHGSFAFWVTVHTEVREETRIDYSFQNVAETVPLTVVPAATCASDCDFSSQDGRKFGYYEPDTESIEWVIEVPAAATGAVGGDRMTVSDVLPSNQRLGAQDPIVVQEAVTVEQDEHGYFRPVYDRTIDATQVARSAASHDVSWTANPGSFYRVLLFVDTTDAGASDVYANSATIAVGRTAPVTVTGQVSRQGGDGTVVGTDEGRFVLKKTVNGTAQVGADREFTVNYAVTTPDGETVSGSGVVRAGGSFTSPVFPRGSEVHLAEQAPADSTSVRWLPAQYSANDFQLEGGQETTITLTNTAILNTGALALTKRVIGSGARAVPVDATYSVDYSYPAGDGYPAGGGSIELRAEATGRVEGLPAGARVTLVERSPVSVAGAIWGVPTFDADTIAIVRDETVFDVLTNRIDTVEPVGDGSRGAEVAGPSPRQTKPGAVRLAKTGWEGVLPVLTAGMGAILLGGAVIAGRRQVRSRP